MKLFYLPADAKRPIIHVAIHSGGRDVTYRLLVDTGADHTCFPASYAEFIGHDNASSLVQTIRGRGVGGVTTAYLHTLRLSLLPPDLVDGAIPPPDLAPFLWTSSVRTFGFFESLHEDFGILGRDLMAEWKCVSIIPKRGRWAVEIEI